MSHERYMSIREAAKMLDLHYTTVMKACQQGRIKGIYRFGRTWRIPRYFVEGVLNGTEELAPKQDKPPEPPPTLNPKRAENLTLLVEEPEQTEPVLLKSVGGDA